MFNSTKAKKLFKELQKITTDDIEKLKHLIRQNKNMDPIQAEAIVFDTKHKRYISAFTAAHLIESQEQIMEAHIRNITSTDKKDIVLN